MKVYLIITNKANGLFKSIDISDYTRSMLFKTTEAYKKNFDIQLKRCSKCLI